jgi:hypothetical protein
MRGATAPRKAAVSKKAIKVAAIAAAEGKEDEEDASAPKKRKRGRPKKVVPDCEEGLKSDAESLVDGVVDAELAKATKDK